MNGNKIAISTLAKFCAVGLRTAAQMESGYSAQQSKAELLTELREAQRKLAFCSIHEDCPKAVFEERNNQKVSQLKQAWIQAGWIDRVAYSVVKHKEVIKGDGHDYLYEANGQIRVKQESKQEAKLITHGVLLGLHGQSDILAFD